MAKKSSAVRLKGAIGAKRRELVTLVLELTAVTLRKGTPGVQRVDSVKILEFAVTLR